MSNFRTDHTTTECAYLAAILDTSSSINIRKSNRYGVVHASRWSSCITVGCSARSDLTHVLDSLMGVSLSRIIKKSASSAGNELHTMIIAKGYYDSYRYIWVCTGPLLDYLVNITEPYIVLHKRKMGLLKEFRETFNTRNRGTPLSREVAERREQLLEEFEFISQNSAENY